MSNQQHLSSALAEFRQRLTNELVAITVEQPGYAGFGFTTRAIVARNLTLWRKGAARRTAKGGRA